MVNASPYGELYDADGKTLRESPNDDLGNNLNPFNDNVYANRLQKNNTFFGTLYAKGNIGYGFSYQVNFTPNFDFYRYFNSFSAKHPSYRVRKGVATRTTATTYNWQIDNIINFDRTFGQHQINATFLLNAEKFQSWREQMDNEGFDPNDNLSYHNMGNGIKPILVTDDQRSTGDALMGRINYTYAGRYNIMGLVRRDGYSAFGLQNPRGTFGSVGVSWSFADEKFFPSTNWFSTGKLRLSYGSNGNRDIGRYQAISDLTTGKYQYISPAGVVTPVSQLWVSRMQNDALRWEKTVASNIGLDLGFFKDRLTVTVDAYEKNTTDLLVNRSLPTVTGFDNVLFNLGGVQ
ncbi:MAG: SusC/RagA family TonB-linked outer membrane protein, partial [Pedobacter sp.]